MAETYIQMFQEEFYPKIFFEIAKDTIGQYVDKEGQIVKQLKSRLNHYMERLVELQEKGFGVPVAEIDISFLYTSLIEGKARFRIDSYGEGGRVLEESMETDYLAADFLVVKLEELTGKLETCVADEGLRRYIRPAEIETLKLRAVRSLLYYFAFRLKYTIREALDLQMLAKVKKANNFAIQIGEYMDWQKTIYAILPEVDIFNCDEDTNLQFRSFPAIYYQNKRFQDLIMNQSRFIDCTFTDVTIEKCRMNDCIFDHCTFDHVKIMETQMKGCNFIDCAMSNTVFEKVVFYSEECNDEEIEYYEPAKFYKCALTSASFKECDMQYCLVYKCDEKEVKITGCSTEKSGFQKFEHDMIEKQEI